jgi:hypothetical protein
LRRGSGCLPEATGSASDGTAASEGDATSEGDAGIDVGGPGSEDAAVLAPGIALSEIVVPAQLQHNAATANATTPSGERRRFLSLR